MSKMVYALASDGTVQGRVRLLVVVDHIVSIAERGPDRVTLGLVGGHQYVCLGTLAYWFSVLSQSGLGMVNRDDFPGGSHDEP